MLFGVTSVGGRRDAKGGSGACSGVSVGFAEVLPAVMGVVLSGEARGVSSVDSRVSVGTFNLSTSPSTGPTEGFTVAEILRFRRAEDLTFILEARMEGGLAGLRALAGVLSGVFAGASGSRSIHECDALGERRFRRRETDGLRERNMVVSEI